MRRSCDRPAATCKAVNGHAGERRKRAWRNWSHKATSHARRAGTLAVCSARNIPDLGEVMVREGYAVNYAID